MPRRKVVDIWQIPSHNYFKVASNSEQSLATSD